MYSRRKVLKMLSTIPVGVTAVGATIEDPQRPVLSANAEMTRAMGPEIFRSIGVEPVINCRGTFTIIGGSIERPQVRAAMDAASQNYIQYDELANGIGQRLAELTKADWGIVTAGCAAALKHATAACVAGGNPEKLIRIPDLTGFEQTEVIIPRSSRNQYDHAVRNIGVDMRMVETLEDLETALNPRTAMIYYLAGSGGPLDLETIVAAADRRDVPVLVDAAAEDLTIPNAHLAKGATMVAYSGGKAIRGPQCAGLLLGPKELLMAAWQASSPHHGPGRDNKVGREEMMGMLAAVEAWVNTDHEAEWETWLSWLDNIASSVTEIDGITTELEEPTIPGMDHPGEPAPISNHSPVLHLIWDPDAFGITGEQLAETMGRTKPRIVVGSGHGDDPDRTSINITAWMMKPEEDAIVADRIKELLTREGEAGSSTMDSPGTVMTGRWNVRVSFFSGESEHTLYIEQQDENWIEGSHRGEFSVRDIAGTVAGSEVKLLSTERQPGDRIEFIFAGTLSRDGDQMSGDVYLGEYLTASFTATRHDYRGEREPVKIPGGPPLAT